jgi:hypothetical protein
VTERRWQEGHAGKAVKRVGEGNGLLSCQQVNRKAAPMDEDALKLEMRLYAVELFVVNILALHCLNTKPPLETFEKTKEQMLTGARQQTFPRVGDPATSDLLSAELEDALRVILTMVKTQINAVLKDRPKST